MSLKFSATKVEEGHYVLPKTGQMKVEAHAFLSDALYEASEEGMWDQLANGASYETIIGAYAMPDCHFGYGVPIGCVLVTDNVIVQACSGYDISCGVLYMKVPGLTAEHVKSWHKRETWVREVENRVATGAGTTRPKYMPKFSADQVNNVLLYGAKALGVTPGLCERHYIPVPEGTDLRKIEKAYDRVVPQLGRPARPSAGKDRRDEPTAFGPARPRSHPPRRARSLGASASLERERFRTNMSRLGTR